MSKVLMRGVFYQRFLKGTAYILIGFLAIGSLLDAVSNAVSLITPFATYLGCSIIVTMWLLIEFFIKKFSLSLEVSKGQLIIIRRLGIKPRLMVLGAILLLWIPRIVNTEHTKKIDPINIQPNSIKEYTEIVIDRSRSMMDKFENGTTKWDAALNAVKEFLYVHDASNSMLSLRQFGGSCNFENLENTKLLVGFEKLNSAKILSALDSVQISGKSNLLRAFTEAIGDFDNIKSTESSNDIKRMIIITGNSDECNPRVAQLINDRLNVRNIRLIIRVVGMSLSSKRMQELSTITKVLGGEVIPVVNKTELKNAFGQALNAEADTINDRDQRIDGTWEITQNFDPVSNINVNGFKFQMEFKTGGELSIRFQDDQNQTILPGKWSQTKDRITFSSEILIDFRWEGIIVGDVLIGYVLIQNNIEAEEWIWRGKKL